MADAKTLWQAWQASYGICACIGICGTTHRCNVVDASLIYRLSTDPSKFLVAKPNEPTPNPGEYDPVEFSRLQIEEFNGKHTVLCSFCLRGARAIANEKREAEAKERARLSTQDGLPFDGAEDQK